jgi:hypothetical protein
MMAGMVDVAEVRKRLIHTIEQVKRDAAARRQATDRAAADYERFLENVATPVCRHFVQALRAQGYGFQLFTPAGSVRLASERGADDYIEVALDTTRQPIAVVGRASHRRGSRLIEIDRPIREGAPIDALTDEDVLAFLLAAIEPFVER